MKNKKLKLDSNIRLYDIVIDAEETRSCQWKCYWGDWTSACGFTKFDTIGTPDTYGYIYCPKCGGKIRVEL